MTEKKIVEYELEDLLEYSLKGKKSETACIIMRAPTMSEYNESERLSQIFARATTDLQDLAKKAETLDKVDDIDEPDKDDAPDEPDPKQIRFVLLASNQSAEQVANKFRALAIKVCTLDEDGAKLKQAHMDNMSISDFNGMMSTYIANFIAPFFSNSMEDKEGASSQKEDGEA